MNNNAQYLRLVAIFHYVVGGLAAFFGCFAFIYVAFGIAIVEGVLEEQKNPPPPAAGWFLIGLGVFIVLLAWIFAFCLILAGRWLARRKHYWYCFVMACIECAFSPFGTVLGVFTIIVLVRPEVKAWFGITADNGQE